jgi:hypothetical protein
MPNNDIIIGPLALSQNTVQKGPFRRLDSVWGPKKSDYGLCLTQKIMSYDITDEIR